jgi:hypothetical protein
VHLSIGAGEHVLEPTQGVDPRTEVLGATSGEVLESKAERRSEGSSEEEEEYEYLEGTREAVAVCSLVW